MTLRNRMWREGVEYYRYRVYFRARGKRHTWIRWYPPGFIWESLQRELEANDVPSGTDIHVRET